MPRLPSIAGILTVAAALAAQPPAGERGPLHPPDDPATFPVEPNPYFNSDLLRYVEDNLPIQNAAQNRYEAQCYEELFLHARRLPADLLRRAAARNIKFYQAFGNDRDHYRGNLIHIAGYLGLLRGYDPPPGLRDDAQGLTIMYEGWIFDAEDAGNNPWCVVFSELPDGLTPFEAKGYRRDMPAVETEGYLFKRYRYGSRDVPRPGGREVLRDAPFVIAKSLRVVRPAEATRPVVGSFWDVSSSALAGMVVMIGAAAVVAGGLWWWFRRDDLAARERLRRLRERTRLSDSGFVPPESRDPFGGSPSLN